MTSEVWSNSIVWYDRRRLIAFDREWRDAVTNKLQPLAKGARALELWGRRAEGVLIVAACDGSSAGEIRLDAPAPKPAIILDTLQLDQAWIFASDLSWGVRADHEQDLSVEMYDNPFALERRA